MFRDNRFTANHLHIWFSTDADLICKLIIILAYASANNTGLELVFIPSRRSLMHIISSKGPKIDPWGIHFFPSSMKTFVADREVLFEPSPSYLWDGTQKTLSVYSTYAITEQFKWNNFMTDKIKCFRVFTKDITLHALYLTLVKYDNRGHFHNYK